jgi:uncharacterized protein YaaN involved in tellurite resistance
MTNTESLSFAASMPPDLARKDLVKSQFSSLGLQDDDMLAVEQLAGQVAGADLAGLSQYGTATTRKTYSTTEELLAQSRAKDHAEVGTRLSEIVTVARGLNARMIGQRSRLPLIGPLVDKVRQKVSQAESPKLESTQEQLDALVEEVSTRQKGLLERVAMFEDMANDVREQYKQLGVHIAAAKLVLGQWESEAEELKRVAQSPLQLEKLEDMRARITALQASVSTLLAVQQGAMMSFPQLRRMQQTHLALVEKFHTLRDVVVPEWKRAFAIRLGLEEERASIELADATDQFSRELMRSNADILAKNSIQAAKAGQRMVYDLDTLQYVQDSMIKTAQDVRQIELEGARDREQLEKGVIAMREHMAKVLLSGPVGQADAAALLSSRKE